MNPEEAQKLIHEFYLSAWMYNQRNSHLNRDAVQEAAAQLYVAITGEQPTQEQLEEMCD